MNNSEMRKDLDTDQSPLQLRIPCTSLRNPEQVGDDPNRFRKRGRLKIGHNSLEKPFTNKNFKPTQLLCFGSSFLLMFPGR